MRNMTIDMEESLKKVNEYIDQIDILQHESHTEGEKKRDEINASIKNFIRIAFQDGEKKLSDYKDSFPMYIGIIGREDTEEEKQEYYLQTLRSIRNNSTLLHQYQLSKHHNTRYINLKLIVKLTMGLWSRLFLASGSSHHTHPTIQMKHPSESTWSRAMR